MPPKTSESLINKLSGKPANMAHGPYHTAYHLPRLSEMRLLFFEKVFNSIGFALVSIFIPIYLLQLNYSIQAVIVYHLAMGLWMLLLIPLSLKLITRIGPNRTMVIGNLGSIVLFILLFTLPSQHWSLWLLAFWRAVASAAYFPAFHANFITARAHERTGTQLGLMNALCLALNGLAPAIGGILASLFGMPMVYAVAAVMMLIGSAPLLFAQDDARGLTFRPRLSTWRRAGRDFLANGLYCSVFFVEAMVWPIFISLIITSYAGIGMMSSLIVISSIVISIYVGRKEDKVGERRFINQGIGAGIMSGLARLFVAGPAGVLGVNLLSGTSNALLASSFISRYYKNADPDQPLEYIFGMEMFQALFWVGFFVILLLASFILPLKALLIFGICLSLPCLLGLRLIKT